jgi:hypothetical protein
VEFDEEWLESEEWILPVYEVSDISESTTIIELHKLRFVLADDNLSILKDHLRATYAQFLKNDKVIINMNENALQPKIFENWAYPPDFQPRKYCGDLLIQDGGIVKVEVLAGLSMESSPAGGEYGVYFYCNDRLIVRALKDYYVGFTKGLAGQPHPSVSLVRVIVSLKGQAKSMPWNSSKSGVNPNHQVFIALQRWLVSIVKDYAHLSRIWSKKEGGWPEHVFKHPTGDIIEIKIDNIPEAKKSYLPPMPKSRLRYGDKIKQANKEIGNQKPWTQGLYESIIAVDLITKQKLAQRNRITLIILDSTLEIAFKEFLVNESGATYNDRRLLQLFSNRKEVQKEINKFVTIELKYWKKIDYYYWLRCKLVHERATVEIRDEQIEDYRKIVQKVLRRLFKLHFN